VSASSVVSSASSRQAEKPAEGIAPKGLTSDDARARLEKDGPKAMPNTSAHPLRNALAKFWAPVPCTFAAAIAFGVVLDVVKIPVFVRLGIS
jgi:H+-transporting ATPase